MPPYRPHLDEKIKKTIHSSENSAQKAFYESYSSIIFGQFLTFCRSSQKAQELTTIVLETSFIELSAGAQVKGKLIVWLIRRVRKAARAYLIDYSVKKYHEHKCIQRLVLSEGFSIREAASLLGICEEEAVSRLRQKLKA